MSLGLGLGPLALPARAHAAASAPAAAGFDAEALAPEPDADPGDATADDGPEPAAPDPSPSPDATAVEPVPDAAAGDDATEEAVAGDDAPADAPRPPRIDGTFLGARVYGGLGLVQVNDFDTDGPFAAFGGSVSIGQMVFPWLGLGLTGGGGGGVRSEQGARQKLGQGFLAAEFTFVPAPKHLPLSLKASFGFGGGAVRQAGIESRSGYGGSNFGAAVRYELFPFARKHRPFRGGGLGLGPELGWVGFTPAAAGRPASHVLYLALSTTFYFGS